MMSIDFICNTENNRFDYAKWQREHFDAKTPEQISKEARAFADTNPHSGNAKMIL